MSASGAVYNVCHCMSSRMYVLVKMYFWIAVLPFFLGMKLSFWLSAFSVLIVVPLF